MNSKRTMAYMCILSIIYREQSGKHVDIGEGGHRYLHADVSINAHTNNMDMQESKVMMMLPVNGL